MGRSVERLNPKAVVVGPSTKNVRIERLWLTLGTQKLKVFRELFFSMEREVGLNRNSDIDLWCLHYIYIPRLNRELENWRLRMNNTKHTADTTEGRRRTPSQIFRDGITMMTADPTVRQEMIERERNTPADHYGVSEERISRYLHPDADENEREHTQWPTVAQLALSEEQLQFIRERFDPLSDDGQYGRAMWLALKTVVTNMLSNDN